MSGPFSPKQSSSEAKSKRKFSFDGKEAILFDMLSSTGIRITQGRMIVPTTRLLWLAKKASAKIKQVENIELVPGLGDMRMHVILRLMNDATRAIVRLQIESFSINSKEGKLRVRLMEAPAFTGKQGGKRSGVIGVLGAVSEAALASLGKEKIVRIVAERVGPPLRAQGDILDIDLWAIEGVRKTFSKETTFGKVGDLVNFTHAGFTPEGLEVHWRLERKQLAQAAKIAFQMVKHRVLPRTFNQEMTNQESQNGVRKHG